MRPSLSYQENLITLTGVEEIQSLKGSINSLKDLEQSFFLSSFSESSVHYFTCISMNFCNAL